MRSAVAFNLSALLALVFGFILLFNPLLGPVLPLPDAVVVIVGVAFLVLACVLGRAGMGKGGFVHETRRVGMLMAALSAGVILWSLASAKDGGRMLGLILAVSFAAVGLVLVVSRPEQTQPTRTNTLRASNEELQAALRSGRQ